VGGQAVAQNFDAKGDNKFPPCLKFDNLLSLKVCPRSRFTLGVDFDGLCHDTVNSSLTCVFSSCQLFMCSINDYVSLRFFHEALYP
jgi:hypothetical protein